MQTENTELSIEITACVMTFNSCEFLYFHDFYTDLNDPTVQISVQISSIRPSKDKRDGCYRAALREFTLHKHSQTAMSSRLNTLERSATKKKKKVSPSKNFPGLEIRIVMCYFQVFHGRGNPGRQSLSCHTNIHTSLICKKQYVR